MPPAEGGGMEINMKKKIVICIAVIGALGMLVPAVGNAMMTDGTCENVLPAKENIKEQELVEQMEKLSELEDDMDELLEKEKYKETEYKALTEEIDNQKIECQVFDYQEEVELRINTVRTAIEDMKRELKRGVPEEVSVDIKNRIKKLLPIVEKYEIIMENEAIEDYESVALALEEELSEVYKEIN